MAVRYSDVEIFNREHATVGTNETPVKKVVLISEETGNQYNAQDTSVIDSNNSTSATLAAAGTYTGTSTDLTGYSNVTIQLHSDVDSASDGMKFQFSTDDSNWDESYDFNLDASDSETRRFQYPAQAQYFRVQYINGASPQTKFRVQTLLHRSGILTSIHRTDQAVTDDRSCQLVKAVITGKQPSGDFTNVQTTPPQTFLNYQK